MSVSSYVSFPPVSSLATMDTLDKIDKAFTIVAKILMFLGALLLGWVKAKPEKRQVIARLLAHGAFLRHGAFWRWNWPWWLWPHAKL